MSHQDRTSDIVVNHHTIKQVVNWLLSPALFVGMRTRAGAKWLRGAQPEDPGRQLTEQAWRDY